MKKKKKHDQKSEVSEISDSYPASKTSKRDDLKNEIYPDKEDLSSFKFCIFILSFAAYSSTCYRSFPGGDSTELIVASEEFGIPHPPGYPLLAITLRIWNSFFRLFHQNASMISFTSALFSATVASCSNVLMFKLLLQCCQSKTFSVVGVTIFGFCHSTWEWAAQLEVFTLNNLLCLLILTTLMDYKEKKCSKTVELGIFFSGLALTNQHTSVLFVIPIAVNILINERPKPLTLLKWILIAALPLSLYLYLPISSIFTKAKWTWGDCSTISGILTHVLRSEYGTFSLASGHSSRSFLPNVAVNLAHFQLEYGLIYTTLGLFAIPLCLIPSQNVRQNAKNRIVVFLFVIYTSFFAWRSNLDPYNSLFYGVLQRFYLQNGMLLIVLASVLLSKIWHYINEHIIGENTGLLLIYDRNGTLKWIALSLCAASVATKLKDNDYSKLTLIEEFGQMHLDLFDEGSVILMKGDLPSNTFRYMELVLKSRPDLTFIDTQPMTYEWYLKKQKHRFHGLNFGSGKKYHIDGSLGTISLQHLIRMNPQKQFYGCINLGELEHFPSDPRNEFLLIPVGSCDKIIYRPIDNLQKYEDPPIVMERLKQYQIEISKWKYEFDFRVEHHTWEYVAIQEMINARIRGAMHIFELAERVKTNELSGKTNHYMPLGVNYYKAAYKLYQLAIGSINGTVPSHWYKNIGVIYPEVKKLGEHDLNLIGSYKETAEYFQKYLDQTLANGEVIHDREPVENAVRSINEWLSKEMKISDEFYTQRRTKQRKEDMRNWMP